MTYLYRVVSELEKADYDSFGQLRTGPNTLEAKQFFKSLNAITEFLKSARQKHYDPEYEYLFTISIDVDKFINVEFTELLLDGFDTINIHEDFLPDFNECIIFVKQSVI